jgi:hypothetical protein
MELRNSAVKSVRLAWNAEHKLRSECLMTAAMYHRPLDRFTIGVFVILNLMASGFFLLFCPAVMGFEVTTAEGLWPTLAAIPAFIVAVTIVHAFAGTFRGPDR